MRVEDIETASSLGSQLLELDSKRGYFDKVLAQQNTLTLSVQTATHVAWLNGEDLSPELLNKVMALIYTDLAERRAAVLAKITAL